MSSTMLKFLGGFEVTIEGRAVTQFATDKTRALLAYLVLEPARPHTRSALAALFWPDIHDHHARVNLRNTLYRLRKTLDTAVPGSSDRMLTITRQDVQFNRESATVDVHEFQVELDAVATHSHASLASCHVCLSHLAAAVALYRGEVLAGLEIVDAAPFEEWLLLRRELLFHQTLKSLSDLSDIHEQQGRIDTALDYAMRAMALDPYRESVHRQVMRLRARQGLPSQALAQYAALRRLMREELDVEPSPESAELARRIAAGELGKPGVQETAAAMPARNVPDDPAPLIHVNWSEAPAVDRFFGRSAEMAQLTQWLLNDHCRLLAIFGLGGVGKTTLAAQLVCNLRQHFDQVLWYSLVNGPQLEEILPSILQILSKQLLSDLPHRLDEQLALLTVYLREQRALLVLDNFESLFDETQAGALQPDYAAYGQLIQQVSSREHRSHLLITSRIRPKGFVRLERDSAYTRSLRLQGLDVEAGQALLHHRGVVNHRNGDPEGPAALVQRYSGNPLALKLVADTVHELFAGDIASFLTEEPLVFDDVRAILDQQFGRLSTLEQEILIWLAVERSAVTAASLQRDLLHAPPIRILLEALRSLLRRALIEQREGGFYLQNVVIEYLTDRLIQGAVQELESGELDLLHRHALLRAESMAYLRTSQARLILDPIGRHLTDRLTPAQLSNRLQSILSRLRADEVMAHGYAAGNLLNLILHLGIDPADFDFSKLSIYQAYLQDISLKNVNFTGADLSQSVFTDDFSSVFIVAISPDGGLLAGGTGNGEIRLWQLPERKLIGSLRDHSNRVLALQFSPDGSQLFSAGMDQVIRIWDVESRKVVARLSEHTGGVRSLAVSADGLLLASVSQDQTARLWALPSGLLLATLSEHADWVNGVAFHPQGHLLATAGHDQAICLWSVPALLEATTSGSEGNHDTALVDKLYGHSDTIVALAFSPDGSTLASSGGDSLVLLWDVNERQVRTILRGHTDWVRTLAFNRTGDILASGSADKTVRLWDVAGQRGLNTLPNSDQVWSLMISPADDLLVCGVLDGTIYLWDLRTQWCGQAYSTLKGYVAPIGTIDYRPDGVALAVADEGRRWVRIWQVVDEAAPRTARLLTGHADVVRSVRFHPDGKMIASVGEDKAVRIWDAQSGANLDVLHGHTRGLHTAAFNRDGSLLATAGDDLTIHLWSMGEDGQGQLVNVLRGHTGSIHNLLFSPPGDLLASVGADSTIRLWDADSGVCRKVIDEYVQDFWSMAFCPDGIILAGGGRDRLIRLWDLSDLENIQPRGTLAGHKGNVLGLAFSPLGSIMASASEDGTIGLWHVPQRRRLHTLYSQGESVMCVSFRPDGKVLASGGFDGAVRLWDPNTGELLRKLQPPRPYDGMNIAGVSGITNAQKRALLALGAVDI